MERTVIEGIDLNDPERFKRLEHHEMFRRLRAEAPVYWQPDELKGGGYWNVVKHADLIEVNRDTATFSSEIGSTQIMSGQYPIGEDPDMPFDTRGVLMLDDGSIFRALLKTGENGGTICTPDCFGGGPTFTTRAP